MDLQENDILTEYFTIFRKYVQEINEMNAEFTRRRDEAIKEYWNACNYPRKKKKKVRKQCIVDIQLYSVLLNE